MVFTWLNLAILLAILFGLVFAAGPVLGSLILAPKVKEGAIGLPYECGMQPYGSPNWIRFGINYYVYALLFLAFDVDVLYLFPVAAHYPFSFGWWPFIKVTIFIVVLALGCVYFWKKGVFEWPRKISF
ncbi:NADH-quinone oxidoreductase subunit A [Desulfobaculum xiamenense]|uniref:NADH-quinone oxidoreductase subunit n=1 Tax=Desulfobaculum xiamenense TaxID=995050 RepID=A0A846QHK7_9BACT|nr:NADH-quinone oxidoreductase subunit A [Desulfobaculum xiamenense]NJB67691.1 NADH-quinone oxidoreductase subunit A [Desulfobaculum xiamenense]